MYERYQTFWRRVGASLIDGMILGPIGYPTTILIGYGPTAVAVAWIAVTCPAGFLYTSYCHGRWGKTLGKHVAGIVVVRADDESRLGYARAVRRDLGAIVFAITGSAILVAFLASGGDTDSFRVFDRDRLTYTEEELETKNPGEVFRESFSESFPPWPTMVIPTLSYLWFIAEMLTMLSNPRRRALHDLIGGSVVVKVSKVPAQVSPAPSSP